MNSSPGSTWPRRTEARERNRAALMRAAAELMSEVGYANASVAQIARRAGLSTGAVYSGFGSKAGLFLALAQTQWGVPQLHDSGRGALADVVESYGRAWARALKRPGTRQAMLLALEFYVVNERDDDTPDVTTDLFRATREQLAEALRAAADARDERLRSPDELATGLIALLQGLSQAFLLGGQPVNERMCGRLARRLVD